MIFCFQVLVIMNNSNQGLIGYLWQRAKIRELNIVSFENIYQYQE
jgi:hypothetical protein